MFSSIRSDARFLDRHGCGDELYFDSRLKAALCVAGLRGLEAYGDDHAADLDLFAGGDDDDAVG